MPGNRILLGIVFLFGALCVEAVRQSAKVRYLETLEFLGSDPMWPRRFVVKMKIEEAPEKFAEALMNTKTKSHWKIGLNENYQIVAQMPLRTNVESWRLQKAEELVIYLEVNACFEEFAGHTTIIWKYRLSGSPHPELFKEVEQNEQFPMAKGAKEALETSLSILKTFGIIDQDGLLTVESRHPTRFSAYLGD